MDGCCFSDMANLRTIVCIDGCPEPPAVLDEYQPPGMSGRSSTLDAADVVFKGLSPARIKSSGGLGRSVAGHRSKLRLAPRHSRGWFGLRRVDLQYANLRAAAVETSGPTHQESAALLTDAPLILATLMQVATEMRRDGDIVDEGPEPPEVGLGKSERA